MSTYPDGSVHVDDVTIPLSVFLSPEARAAAVASAGREPEGGETLPLDLDGWMLALRALAERNHRRLVAELVPRFGVTIEERSIGGVTTDVIRPAAGARPGNEGRVLINLHGGGWFLGARFEGQSVSIPVVGLGGIEVVTVDYRMAPEHRHPAAAEDIAAVYRALLEDHAPDAIGLFGHSAGGALAAQMVPWFERVGLPRPGAIAVLGSAVGLIRGGDSYFTNAIFTGSRPEPHLYAESDTHFARAILRYWEGSDHADPVISPWRHADVLARFPPTLVLNSYRDHTASDAIYGHTQLVKAGVDAELHLWEGLGHGFLSDHDTPEFREAYDVIVRFFDRRLAVPAG